MDKARTREENDEKSDGGRNDKRRWRMKKKVTKERKAEE